MSQVLFAWELGGGIGHLMRLRPLAQELAKGGHRIAFALRDLSRAESTLAGIHTHFFQAPVVPGQSRERIEPASTLPHVLYNTGFSSSQQLAGMVASWQAILDSVKPDLIVLDHSPTALVATRGGQTKRVVVGTGFSCPPSVDPMLDWRPWMKNDPAKLRRDEHHVRDVVNQVLRANAQRPIARLSDLFTDVDDTLLATVKELDAVPCRGAADYFGEWSGSFGKAPCWPSGNGQRVFAYLKPFPTLPFLLAELVRCGLPTIVFSASLPAEVIGRFQAPTVTYENEPLDMEAVAAQCDVAILNATHGSTFQLLRCGKPLLNVPLNLEQRVTADNVVRIGAGIWVEGRTCQDMRTPLQQLLTNPQFANAASLFANRYADFAPRRQLARATSRVNALLEE